MNAQTPRHIRPVLGVSVACWHRGEVLLAQRGKAPNKGLWSLPGGHVELGETLEEAALRELGEETALTAELGGLATFLDIIRRDGDGAVEVHYVIAVFRASWRSGMATAGDDAAAVQWRRPDDMHELEMTGGTAKLLQRMAAGEL